MIGEIKHCANSGCGYKCCDFGSKGHIIMMPNEYKNEFPTRLTHLKIIDDHYMGGTKVRCTAENKKNCDGGYKPIQCRIFPLWVRGDGEMEKSVRCPLSWDQMFEHEQESKEILNDHFVSKLFNTQPSLDLFKRFLDKAKVRQYVKRDDNSE